MRASDAVRVVVRAGAVGQSVDAVDDAGAVVLVEAQQAFGELLAQLHLYR